MGYGSAKAHIVELGHSELQETGAWAKTWSPPFPTYVSWYQSNTKPELETKWENCLGTIPLEALKPWLCLHPSPELCTETHLPAANP